MTDETRSGPGGDTTGAREDRVLPLPPARRTGAVLRPGRAPRRHPPDRQGPAKRRRTEQGDGTRAARGRTDPGGSPLVVGERSGTGTLEDGVIYTRFGVSILSRRTLGEFLEEGVPPFLYSAPGGLYVRLDADALRRLREERQVSLGTLADIAGVTRRTIQMYLEGMSATMEVAMRLEEFLNESLVMPVDPFALLADPAAREERLPQIEGFEREMFERLERLGYRVLRTVRSPFDALSKHDETTFLTGVGEADRALERKAEVVSNLSRVVEKDSVMFVERARVRMSIRGVPVIAREELRRAKDRDDVEEMISERKG